MQEVTNIKEFLGIIETNYTKVVIRINEDIGEFLSNMHEHCYYPPAKRTLSDIEKILDIDFRKLSKIIKKEVIGDNAWHLINNTKTWVLLILMRYALSKNDKKGFSSIPVLFTLRYYTLIMYRRIKFCNKDRFNLASSRELLAIATCASPAFNKAALRSTYPLVVSSPICF